MKPLLDDNDQVFLVYKITGTALRPSVRLVKPELPSLQETARRAGADLTDIARKRAAEAVDSKKEEAEAAAREKAKEETGELRDKAGDRVKKLF